MLSSYSQVRRNKQLTSIKTRYENYLFMTHTTLVSFLFHMKHGTKNKGSFLMTHSGRHTIKKPQHFTWLK
jgi:hypothetical protein